MLKKLIKRFSVTWFAGGACGSFTSQEVTFAELSSDRQRRKAMDLGFAPALNLLRTDDDNYTYHPDSELDRWLYACPWQMDDGGEQ